MYTDKEIARVCHAALREFVLVLGEDILPEWSDLSEELRQLNISGVALLRRDPSRSAEDCHREWMTNKLAEGWTYGDQKDDETKTHPSLVDYWELSVSERQKDELFRSVCTSMLKLNQG